MKLYKNSFKIAQNKKQSETKQKKLNKIKSILEENKSTSITKILHLQGCLIAKLVRISIDVITFSCLPNMNENVIEFTANIHTFKKLRFDIGWKCKIEFYLLKKLS